MFNKYLHIVIAKCTFCGLLICCLLTNSGWAQKRFVSNEQFQDLKDIAFVNDSLSLSSKSVSSKSLTTSEFVIIQNISFSGHKKTRDFIIRREIDLKEGDTLSRQQIASKIERIEERIFNINLFLTVNAYLQYDSLDNRFADLHINLRERWYVFPMVVFELADRNFNEWWYDRGKDLSRVNYGGKLWLRNVRGRNESLGILVQEGFLPKYQLSYTIPYIDRRQRHGIGVEVTYSQNKALAYQTRENKLVFLESDQLLRERFKASLGITRRDGLYKFHRLQLSFHYNHIHDTIAYLNPAYYLNGQTQQRFWDLTYRFQYDQRDFASYPLKGSLLQFTANKIGLFASDDVDILSVSAGFDYYKPLFTKWYASLGAKVRGFMQERQPYSLAQGLGYGDEVLRGFQLFIIDGQSYFLARTTLKWKAISWSKEFNFIPIKQFRRVPIDIYPKIFSDAGYVYDQVFERNLNQLANKPLYNFGVGLDIVSFYNLVFQFDYTLNSEGQKGLFFTLNGAF